jgi:hypothetical protein
MRSVWTSLPTIQLVSQPLIACNVPNAPSVTRTLKTQIQVRRKHGAQLHPPGHCGVRVRYYEAPNRLRQPCKTHHDPLRAHLGGPQCPNPSTAKFSPPPFSNTPADNTSHTAACHITLPIPHRISTSLLTTRTKINTASPSNLL